MKKLAAALIATALLAPAPATAGVDPVQLVEITVDRKAVMGPARAHVTITGTVRCNGEGTLHVELDLTQKAVVGRTNFDLSPFACSTTARPFRADLENLSSEELFRSGKAVVRVEQDTANVYGEHTVTVVRPKR